MIRLAPRGATRSGLDLTPSDAIDSLVVLDRQVDMITPLLTQLTYEGLVDEMIGIQNCKNRASIVISYIAFWATQKASSLAHVELPALPSNPGPSNAPTLTKDKTKKYHLNASADTLLAEIRDMNYAHVPIRLNQVARQLSADYDVSFNFEPFSTNIHSRPETKPSTDSVSAQRLCGANQKLGQ